MCAFFFKYMGTNIPDVYAAGDVASFPLSIHADRRVNIGHWQLAQAHGTAKKTTNSHELHIELLQLIIFSVFNWYFRTGCSFKHAEEIN